MIRTWNVKGKSFDVNISPATRIFYHLKERAQKKLQLSEYFRDHHKTLNEMYLSFMDPNGEIINFQFLDPDRPKQHQVMHQLYFRQGAEKRELVFENPTFDMFTRFITSEDGRDMIPVVEKSEWRAFGRSKEMKKDWSQILRDFIEDSKIKNEGKLSTLRHHEMLHEIVREQGFPVPDPISKDERPVIDIGQNRIVKVNKTRQESPFETNHRNRVYSKYDFDFDDLDF